MTLADLLSSPIPQHDVLRSHWLVFDAALADQLHAAQSPDARHIAQPIMLTDGRMALCADLLTEVSDGVFSEPFAKLDAALFGEVHVMGDNDFRQLLPASDIDS